MTEAEIQAQETYGSNNASLLSRAGLNPTTSTSSSTSSVSENSTSSSPSSATTNNTTVTAKVSMKHTVVTCLEVIKREKEGETEQSSLIVGTEAGQILLLDCNGSTIDRTIQLPSVPVHIVIHGVLKGEHRINVSCRDGIIYAIRNGEILPTKIEPPAPPVSMVRTDNLLYVASLDSRITAYEPKGKKVFTLPQPSPITAMTRMQVRRDRGADCVAIALEGGSVRVYNQSILVTTLQCPDTIVGMRFGQYGREANTLVLVSRTGSLSFRMLKRTANMDGSNKNTSTVTNESDIPLAIPKKTRLYLDQTQREKDAAPDMYRIFQRDLVRLRLTTAQSYVKVLTGGLSTVTSSSSNSSNTNIPNLRLNCTVQGLGPHFTLKIDLQNANNVCLKDLVLSVTYDSTLYYMELPTLAIPIVLPNVRYVLQRNITSISPTGAAGTIRVHICRKDSLATPSLITGIVGMPLSQPLPGL